jgi:DNA-3-methyladenine glycosylase II
MGFGEQLRQAEKSLTANDQLLKPLIRKYGPCRLKPHTSHYAELVSSIVGQQLSVKAGDTIWKRVLNLFGGTMPKPLQLLAIDDESLRACGVSYAKISYMKDLARHIVDGRLDLAHASTLDNEELVNQLVAVKGIGPWSAHMFMIFSLGRLDILPVGDLGIQKAVQKIYGLKELPKPAEVELISAKNHWNPYESVASWYLWQSLDNSVTS